jgi:hypothetical protein
MPQPTGQGFVTPQCQMISHPNSYQTPNTRNHRVQRTPIIQDTTPMKAGKTSSTVEGKTTLPFCVPIVVNNQLQLKGCLPHQTTMQILSQSKLDRTMLKHELINWLWQNLRTPLINGTILANSNTVLTIP